MAAVFLAVVFIGLAFVAVVAQEHKKHHNRTIVMEQYSLRHCKGAVVKSVKYQESVCLNMSQAPMLIPEDSPLEEGDEEATDGDGRRWDFSTFRCHLKEQSDREETELLREERQESVFELLGENSTDGLGKKHNCVKIDLFGDAGCSLTLDSYTRECGECVGGVLFTCKKKSVLMKAKCSQHLCSSCKAQTSLTLGQCIEVDAQIYAKLEKVYECPPRIIRHNYRQPDCLGAFASRKVFNIGQCYGHKKYNCR